MNRDRGAVSNLSSLEGAGVDMAKFMSFSAAMLRQHGYPPTGKSVAANHEAGHAIVAIALDRDDITFKSATITKVDGKWIGFTDYDADHFFSVKDTPVILSRAAVTIAGVVAERITGCSHPVSSLEEIATCQAYIRHAFGEQGEQVFNLLMNFVSELIKENKIVFDLIRNRLLRDRKVRAKDVEKLRHLVTPISISRLEEAITNV